jgi:hypothetical protein
MRIASIERRHLQGAIDNRRAGRITGLGSAPSWYVSLSMWAHSTFHPIARGFMRGQLLTMD